MTETVTLLPGMVVWTKGSNEYGDDALGGAYIRHSHDPETGEVLATILTYQAAKPRQASLHLLDRRGGNRDLGLLARLVRVPVSDIRPPQDNLRDYHRVWQYALRALVAASLKPNNEIESRAHDAMVDAYRVLRDEAIMLRRGAA